MIEGEFDESMSYIHLAFRLKMTNECGVLVRAAVGDVSRDVLPTCFGDWHRDMGLKVNTHVGLFVYNSVRMDIAKNEDTDENDIHWYIINWPAKHHQCNVQKRFLYRKVNDYCPLLANKFNALPARINPH